MKEKHLVKRISDAELNVTLVPRFTDPQKQSRMIEGVSVAIGHGGIGDYDELLREAVRVALRHRTTIGKITAIVFAP
jgi:hypothetical protein